MAKSYGMSQNIIENNLFPVSSAAEQCAVNALVASSILALGVFSLLGVARPGMAWSGTVRRGVARHGFNLQRNTKIERGKLVYQKKDQKCEKNKKRKQNSMHLGRFC